VLLLLARELLVHPHSPLVAGLFRYVTFCFASE
jgi:hypothetical protein